MKHMNSISISIGCFLIILLSASCNKDSLNAGPSTCINCNKVILSSLLINDSNWVRQDDGNYTSDLTMIIEHAGASVSQVYAMDVAGEDPVLKIFPEINGDYMRGILSGSVNLSKNKSTCVITYEFSKEEHEGEVHPAGPLPFKSVEIEVFLVNQNK
jgi:hypothetical protein